MAQGGNLGNRITDLIGATYNTEVDYAGDLINAAINEIADMLNPDVLIKYSKTPGELTSDSGFLVEGKKILKVTRTDTNSTSVEKECTAVDRAFFADAGDNGSIYKATAYSPIYHHDTANAGAGTIKVLPEPTTDQKARIWYFDYVTATTPDVDITDLTDTTLNTTVYLPNNLMHAIALKSSINILKAYISNQVQDEEDIELMQMIQAQMGILEKDFQTEMQRYIPKQEETGGE